ncbi:TIGR01459 family HAD-type hydrolase [Rhodobacteraceae bacterium Araon29]
MTQQISSLAEIAANYDAIVLDQWGVLHDGSAPYGHALEALTQLHASGIRLAVLSNSGKRAALNVSRIEEIGFPLDIFSNVMTSGEALWQDIAKGLIPARRFFAIERSSGDAKAWALGLDIEFCDLRNAEAVLLMGLPDRSLLETWEPILFKMLEGDLPIYCSNPDRQSPRREGLVISPGALGFAYADLGGNVCFYGKPHRPVFQALEKAFGSDQLLMVGDSLEHDIAGAQKSGWDSVLVCGGLYAADFKQGAFENTLARLVTEKECNPPTYTIEILK